MLKAKGEIKVIENDKKKSEDVIVVDNFDGKEDEVIIVSEDLQKKVEEAKVEQVKVEVEPVSDEVVLVDTPIVAPVVEEKSVKIRMAKNHRCFIGGTWYDLVNDQVYTVPKNVKDVLLKANLLKPL